MAKRETFSASIRRRIAKVSGQCPTCGGEGRTIRAVAKAAGVDQSVIFRIRKGLSISMGNLDSLVAWLEREESLLATKEPKR